MSLLLTSLENDTEMKAIGRNNNLLQRKCSNFEQQREEICRSMDLLEMCSSQTKRMTAITEGKRCGVRDEVKQHQKRTQKFFKESVTTLNSSFEKLDSILTKNHSSLHCGSSELSVTIPYDACIQEMLIEEEKSRLKLEEIAKFDDILKKEKEDMEKIHNTTAKAKGKAEKDMTMLKEEIEKQTNIGSEIQKAVMESQKQMSLAKDDLSKYTILKTKLEMEINEAKQDYEEALQKNVVSGRLQASRDDLATLDEFFAEVNVDTEVDIALLSNLSDCDLICQLFNELKSLRSINSIDSNSLINLRSTLEDLKKQTSDAKKYIEQMNELNSKYEETKELLARKKSGIEDYEKQIEENTITLNALKVTENSAKPLDAVKNKNSKKEEVLHRLEATRNEIPEPYPYQSYRTPIRVNNESDDGPKWNARATKKISVGLDSTRSMNSAGPLYPGIKLVHPKSPTHTKTIPSISNRVISEFNESAVSEDDYTDSGDSASTQDESAIEKFLGPTGNNKTGLPPFEEFSMADHINDFSKRQANKKSAIEDQKILNGTDSDVEDEDDLDTSLFIQKKSEIVVDSEGDNELDDNADDDEDDDLYVPDNQENLDQSTWGSDD